MARADPRASLALVLCVPWLASACLPTDTRNPPGELIVSASPDEALSRGFTSDDGWSIAYTRFLIVLGDAFLQGTDSCDAYTQGSYNRILDMGSAPPQRVSLIYGLGGCEFTFWIEPPRENSVLGAGVSAADVTFMRTTASDAHTEGAGISVYMEGVAESGSGHKEPSWAFRPFIGYLQCVAPQAATNEASVTLIAEQETLVDLRVRGTALFQQAPREPVGALLFEPFREADDIHGDADGTITLEELQNSPLPPGLAPTPQVQTLGDRVYLELLSDIVRFQGNGTCAVELHTERPGFGAD